MIQPGVSESDSGGKDGGVALQVSVMFVGLIQRTVGQRQVSLSLPPGATLRTLVRELAARYGPELQERLLDGEVLAPHATVLIEGSNALHHGGLDASLGNGDTTRVEIVLLGPPVMGG